MHNPIILDCYTFDEEVYSNYPVQRINKRLPEWWVDLPKDFKIEDQNVPTMKSCAGLIDYFSSGFTIPLWTDIDFKIGETMTDGIECNISEVQVHPTQQRGNFLSHEKYQHLKLLTPWVITCEEDIKFAFTFNTWSVDNPEEFVVPPGVIDFLSQRSASINMFLVYNGITRDVHLSSGFPIINMIPLSSRKLEIRNHLIDGATWVEMNNSSAKLQKQKPKCPFGH